MLVDLDGFSDASWVSSVDRNDELCVFPINDVVLGMRVFDNGRFVIVPSASVGNVFFESGGEISASLADI